MYRHWADRMAGAAGAKERSSIVAEMCRTFGRSKDWAYKRLAECGYESGRRRRSDLGSSAQDEATLRMLASVLTEAVRKNGKATMSVPVARSILAENGVNIAVGDSRLRALLREKKMDVRAMAGASPAQYMRSLHPNHVHMVDPSLALVYYLPSGGQVILKDDEVYKNKQFLPGKEYLKCWRYVLVDHYSGSLCVRYYQSAGESSVNLWDYLLYAWGPKEDPAYAFHGLPEILGWDCGSANTSRAITTALESLRVKTIAHLPGNPRAKGSVEGGNNIVECGLESRLRFEPVATVEELNALADRWCAAFNANHIAGLDCRISRMGRRIGSRLSLWQKISEEQLRELPDAETCRLLLTVASVTRKLDGHLSFSYDHPRAGRRFYRLNGQPGATVGMDVIVQPVLTEPEPIVIAKWSHKGEQIVVEVAPIELDDAGFVFAGAVYGEEYKSPKETLVERNAKDLKTLAYDTLEPKKGAVPFASWNDGQGLAAHSFISTEGMDIKPARKTGREVEITQAETVTAYDIRISAAEAAKRIRSRAGWLPEGYLDGLRKQYPEGVPSGLVDDLAADLLHGDAAKFAKEA